LVHYVGILDGSGDVWGVRIPDLPGCNGGGGTADEAITDAVSAAAEWAAFMSAKGRALPPARTLEQILEDTTADLRAGEVAVMIPVILESGRPVRANLSLDAGLLDAIDAAAKARGLTRSAFIASAAREKIAAEA
jgi:predicted RNase H-like HicB family nuclease